MLMRSTLLLATAAVAGRKLYVQKQEADKLLKAQKAEAGQAAAEVAQQGAALNAQLDEVYNHPEVHGQFLAIGLTPGKWAALSPDEKLKIIEYLSKGEVPPGYAIVQEAIRYELDMYQFYRLALQRTSSTDLRAVLDARGPEGHQLGKGGRRGADQRIVPRNPRLVGPSVIGRSKTTWSRTRGQPR